jgi:hypothetical protein
MCTVSKAQAWALQHPGYKVRFGNENMGYGVTNLFPVPQATLFLPITVNHSIEIWQTIWQNWN